MQFAASSSSCQISVAGDGMQNGPAFRTPCKKSVLSGQQTKLSKHISFFDNRHNKALLLGNTFNRQIN